MEINRLTLKDENLLIWPAVNSLHRQRQNSFGAEKTNARGNSATRANTRVRENPQIRSDRNRGAF